MVPSTGGPVASAPGGPRLPEALSITVEGSGIVVGEPRLVSALSSSVGATVCVNGVALCSCWKPLVEVGGGDGLMGTVGSRPHSSILMGESVILSEWSSSDKESMTMSFGYASLGVCSNS